MSTGLDFNQVLQQNGEESGHGFGENAVSDNFNPDITGKERSTKEGFTDFSGRIMKDVPNNRMDVDDEGSFSVENSEFSNHKSSASTSENDTVLSEGITEKDKSPALNENNGANLEVPHAQSADESVDMFDDVSNQGRTENMETDGTRHLDAEESRANTARHEAENDSRDSGSAGNFGENNKLSLEDAEDSRDTTKTPNSEISDKPNVPNLDDLYGNSVQSSGGFSDKNLYDDDVISTNDVENEDTRNSESKDQEPSNSLSDVEDDSQDVSKNIEMADVASTKDSDFSLLESRENSMDPFSQNELSRDVDGDNSVLEDVEMAPRVETSMEDDNNDDKDPFCSTDVADECDDDSKKDRCQSSTSNVEDSEQKNSEIADIDSEQKNSEIADIDSEQKDSETADVEEKSALDSEKENKEDCILESENVDSKAKDNASESESTETKVTNDSDLEKEKVNNDENEITANMEITEESSKSDNFSQSADNVEASVEIADKLEDDKSGKENAEVTNEKEEQQRNKDEDEVMDSSNNTEKPREEDESEKEAGEAGSSDKNETANDVERMEVDEENCEPDDTTIDKSKETADKVNKLSDNNESRSEETSDKISESNNSEEVRQEIVDKDKETVSTTEKPGENEVQKDTEKDTAKDNDSEKKSDEMSTKDPVVGDVSSTKEKSNNSGAEIQVTPDVVGADDDDEEMCIIPDLPRSNTSGSAPKTVPSAEASKIVIRPNSTETSKNEKVEAKATEKRSSRPQRQAAKRAESQIKELVQEESKLEKTIDEIVEIEETTQCCMQCFGVRQCRYKVFLDGKTKYICQEVCYLAYQKNEAAFKPSTAPGLVVSSSGEFIRRCAQCYQTTDVMDEKSLSWETMDFCNEKCLGKYQTQLGSHCANCKGVVQPSSLGKYCVRFGYDIRQFCCSTCLEEFKKGLKVCSYCQKDISSANEGFLAPVGDKGQFKDFCTPACMEKYDQMSNNLPPPHITALCAVCNEEKTVKIEVLMDGKMQKLCSEPCFAAFKFVNSLSPEKCDMCKKYFDKVKTDNYTVFYEGSPHAFCSKTCMNVYILANRKIVPCNWCKVKKYNFDMIKRNAPGQALMMCSLHCLSLYQVSINAVSLKRVKCDMCSNLAQAQYHLTMSDATVRNFCSYPCVGQFQSQYGKTATVTPAGPNAAPVPTSGPKRVVSRTPTENQKTAPVKSTANSYSPVPVISSVTSLADGATTPVSNSVVGPRASQAQALKINNSVAVTPGQQAVTAYRQQIIVKPPPPKEMRNKATSCKPCTHTKGVSCRPHPAGKETQTDDSLGKPILIPVPVPIYVPVPVQMYSIPYPVPVPFPLPIPVPMFIPTTRNSINGIMKEIKKIQEKIPADPFEAELLMMAEMVAGDKKADSSDSDSDDAGAPDTAAADAPDEPVDDIVASETFSPDEAVDTTNTFGEDMLQIALKMATELDEPAVDLEAALTPATIPAQSQSSVDATEESEDDPEPVPVKEPRVTRSRKRGRGRGGSVGAGGKRGRRSTSSVDTPLLPPPEASPAASEIEKPDANMCLKYTFGVNAWKNWVQQKNAELEKAASNSRKLKLFKPEILQLTADELNYSLCLFVKEVRKPNGQEYAPDTIYYLCLGIQQYLFENGRIDNIFTDTYYEKFTECLDEVARKFTILNDAQYIVTRVEEEHLWESKQLGAHSPHVLLGTLLFFNTKHFNLTTVEEHMQLSFSHIMKHWKRNPNQPGAAIRNPAAARNVLLRFYPPQSALDANSKKKKVYEQQENESNPLRCPVKLYEFYLSKCPESVKTRNDVFYLLPERSCVPDSPVWYSTMALGKEPLLKMLNRVKMVKEINIALLST